MRRNPDHLPKPCIQCGFPSSMSESQHLRRVQEDRFQYESLRRAVAKMIAAGLSPRETLGEIMWRLEINAGMLEDTPILPLSADPYRDRLDPVTMRRRSRVHPEWGSVGSRRGN